MKAHWMRTAILMGALSGLLIGCAKDANMLQRTAFETDSLGRAIEWINSPPLSTPQLRGKVVLVDFWTYSCINWRRTMPYLRSWAEKYRDHGLVVIGVHTPEFGFEKDIDNVRRATREQHIDYPVAIDSDYEIWEAFDNHYWPALYFVDAQGRIRHQQFGEGNYDQLEAVIVELLAEAGHSLPAPELAELEGHGAEAAADWKNLRSPETYLGYGRSGTFASTTAALLETAQRHDAPARLRLNQWAFAGHWTTLRESAVLHQAGGRITYRFHARDVHLVMGPGAGGKPVRFRVSIDGDPPGASRGVDVDSDGRGVVDQPRMYTLIRQSSPIVDRLFEIEFLDPGAEVFVFTFG
jgi:thiol-disulfide isomerase/thioredoxin